MGLLKLQEINAFVYRDLDDETPAMGIVRAAPKVLQSSAKDLARSQTYQCAVLNMRCQGASAGISAPTEERGHAIATFVAELGPLASSGAVMLDPGKGVEPAALAELARADARHEALERTVDGVPNRNHLLALGAVVAADSARPLDGLTIGVDTGDSVGGIVARHAVARGARVVAVETSAGTVTDPNGIDADRLVELAARSGESSGSADLASAPVDVLFVGAKIGRLNHTVAPSVGATMVVPIGPIPYTTKGVLMLEAAGTTVLPDFITTAGPLFAANPPAGADQASIEATVTAALSSLIRQVTGQSDVAILTACHQAESFLASWRDELPFGRPFAA